LPPIPNARISDDGVFTVSENDQDHYEVPRLDFFDVLFARKSIDWLWPGYIPLGKVTLLEGASGTGKSYLGLDIAARVSRGAPWPGQVQGPQQAGHVLLLASEDGRDDTLLPRLTTMGADFDRFTCLSAVRMWTFGGPPNRRQERRIQLPKDLGHVEYLVRSVGDTRLVLIDPLADYCSDLRQTTETLGGLSDLADRCGVAVVVIVRPTSRLPLNRCYDAARCAYRVLLDPTDEQESQRYLAPVRMNFSAEPDPLPFSINAGGLAWGDPTETCPALAVFQEPAAEKVSVLREVMSWIREMLAPGDEPVAAIRKQARECGYSFATLRRARTALGVRTYQMEHFGSRTHFWSIKPEESNGDSQGSAGGHTGKPEDPLMASLRSSAQAREMIGNVLHGKSGADDQALAQMLKEFDRHNRQEPPRGEKS